MDLAMWTALDAHLQSLEADPSVNAVVITSGLKRDVFSAGNDLKELYAPHTSAERYRAFWVAQNAFLVRLLTSRLATVAAIRGACPAGGCAISLCRCARGPLVSLRRVCCAGAVISSHPLNRTRYPIRPTQTPLHAAPAILPCPAATPGS
jgi:hypothetical protein